MGRDRGLEKVSSINTASMVLVGAGPPTPVTRRTRQAGQRGQAASLRRVQRSGHFMEDAGLRACQIISGDLTARKARRRGRRLRAV